MFLTWFISFTLGAAMGRFIISLIKDIDDKYVWGTVWDIICIISCVISIIILIQINNLNGN